MWVLKRWPIFRDCQDKKWIGEMPFYIWLEDILETFRKSFRTSGALNIKSLKRPLHTFASWAALFHSKHTLFLSEVCVYARACVCLCAMEDSVCVSVSSNQLERGVYPPPLPLLSHTQVLRVQVWTRWCIPSNSRRRRVASLPSSS